MRKILLLLLITICFSNLNAAPFQFLPNTIIQPNGEKIECFVSGDEFFNWIHDKDGYTIIQAPDGYFYYAVKKGEALVPSEYKVSQIRPQGIGVAPWTKISRVEYQKKVQRYQVSSSSKSSRPNHAPLTGTLNNVVIYIRFSGESEIVKTRENYDNKMNPTTGVTLKAYFNEVSYGNLTISSTHYPPCASPTTTNASYEDSHTRGYFQPYNATTNTIGYKTDSESTQREHKLLYDAVTWVNTNYPVNPSLDIDADADGFVDNVCFMIKGNSGGWSDLLWAHRWSLTSYNISINGKRVYDYTFQPENQVTVNTLCHEMFHALGAPDLYHYDANDIFTPVGRWDIMESGEGHMGAYMKWKYAGAKWITSIPEIASSGSFSLNPLTSPTNNCFKILSPSSNKEFFILEYRKQSGNFESNLPGSGLLVYRINSDFEGNANFDNSSTFDEVYIYRPDGTVQTDGSIVDAFFTADLSRTAINDITNPSSFLHNGMPGGLDISNVTTAGSSISFDVYISDVLPPQSFTAVSASESQVNLAWSLNANSNDVLVVSSTTPTIGSPVRGVNYSLGSTVMGGGIVIYSGSATSFNHTSLTSGTNYFYRIWSKSVTNEYSPGVSVKGTTNCSAPIIPIVQGFNGSELSPCWNVEVVTVGDVARYPASITLVQSSSNPDATPNEGSHMIKFNSMDSGAGNVMRLSSPSFSSVGQSQLNVNFDWHRDNETPELDKMTIQWSTDGINWTSGTTYQRYNTVTGWTHQSYKLPDAALGQSNLRIAFLFTSEFGYNCYLDNLKIEQNATVVESVSSDEVIVYPNPTKGLFKVKTTQLYNNTRIEVRDICGKLIYSNNYRNSNDNTIDLTNQSTGLYIISIHADNIIINQKVVIE